MKADWLFLLTDVDSLYTANPATHPKAVRIPEVHDITKLQVCIPDISPPTPPLLPTKNTFFPIAPPYSVSNRRGDMHNSPPEELCMSQLDANSPQPTVVQVLAVVSLSEFQPTLFAHSLALYSISDPLVSTTWRQRVTHLWSRQ